MAKKKSKSNENVKCVLIRISTQEILKYKVNYPQAEITPIESLDADLEWLIVNNLGRPVYDETTEKLEKVEEITTEPHPDYPELNQYKIYFNIIALTQEEIDALVDGDEENEAELKLDVHVSEGEQLFRKCYKKIWRRRHKNSDAPNKLTQKEARDLMEWFQPVYLWLKTGNWHQARKEVNKNALLTLITTANVQGMTNTYQFLVDKIEDYFQTQYDL